MTFNYSRSSGMTLIELLIALAVIGILTAIIVQAYAGYLDTAIKGAMRSNIETLHLFQEQYRLETGDYKAGSYLPSDPAAATGLKTTIGWDPGADEKITYVVALSVSGFTVTATDPQGVVLVVEY